MPEPDLHNPFRDYNIPSRRPRRHAGWYVLGTLALCGGACAGGLWLHSKFYPQSANQWFSRAEQAGEPVKQGIGLLRQLGALVISSTPETEQPAGRKAGVPADIALSTGPGGDDAALAKATSAGTRTPPAIPAEPPARSAVAATTSAPVPADAAGLAQALSTADQLLAKKDFAAAKSALLTVPESATAYYPGALYRLGMIGRYTGDEKFAQDHWETAYQKFPGTVPGRLSAMALADTWFYWFAQQKTDYAQWEKIRDAYSAAIGMDGARFLDAATESRIAERLTKLNEKLVFDPEMKVRGAEFHTVRPGEYISSIARQYGLDSWSSIVSINHMDPKRIREGMVLKVLPGRMFILVDKARFTLSFYMDGKFIKRYRCATGAKETETPAGRYLITRMDVEPTWTDPKSGQLIKYGDPGHPIGTRWMAMKGGSTSGLGIHGTVDPASIGTKASNGCVRLLNKDVEELYGFASIQPGNETEVLIIE